MADGPPVRLAVLAVVDPTDAGRVKTAAASGQPVGLD